MVDYNEVLEWKDFSSPEKLSEWMSNATDTIRELARRAELAETAIEEIQSARDHTRPACVVDDILRAYYKEREESK